MRKSLDTRLIDNLNKRRPIVSPNRNKHIITEKEIYRTYTRNHSISGKKILYIYLNELYTGSNDIGYYLEENFDLNEFKIISINVKTLPDFYFHIVASNEVGDDLISDYDLILGLNFVLEREMPAQVLINDLSYYYASGTLETDEPEFTFINFNGVWLKDHVIWEAE